MMAKEISSEREREILPERAQIGHGYVVKEKERVTESL